MESLLPIDRIAGVRVLVVGDTMLDRYWTGTVDRISPEAPVPVVKVEQVQERAGGAGNVAANIASLGAGSQLLSFVGDDDAGRRVNSILELAGVDRHLHIDPSSRTTEKLRIVSRNQQLLRADFEDRPDSDLLARSVTDFRELLSGADAVVISDYGKGGLANVAEMIGAAKERGVPVVVDPKGGDFTRYFGATMVTPNRQEFESITGVPVDAPQFAQAAAELVESAGLEGLLVTLGPDGMVLFLANGEVIRQEARAREVYDVSGAGDTVVAVIAVAIGLKLDWTLGLELATRGASAVVGRFGTSVVSLSDLQDYEVGPI
ncbi:MAG: D-glycero-beta-D-manno-heptose-7-phosphate kinase [Acidiferrobacteraceae bacterium]|jgi:rfaE bifunctional protein kinase chain/domain|nr:D-glycero-beta-D-manno-heptose-7-phosphate kinase [Acidiferrobacteraceae bacterium]MBT3974460.1 D-glycero-beta-D-manno-heptose-7-phosphate kinase [Acidiferrobacteraceae bacterium]MBT4396250.1 D-glycero-beta-D-manno-heptose-7-phosphate kinase [Acidiferrobacteraceae bacterium]MBT4406043.1 D-glycero-beta-D-manno-heptose-7-phosphate kinase [Acidiferrobacteraceae bacterium]MBT4805958.1 D-glycero-beta-D-manno-heptose-7-phosphate kinase [Acidiferrobacteraceae bacterium]